MSGATYQYYTTVSMKFTKHAPLQNINYTKRTYIGNWTLLEDTVQIDHINIYIYDKLARRTVKRLLLEGYGPFASVLIGNALTLRRAPLRANSLLPGPRTRDPFSPCVYLRTNKDVRLVVIFKPPVPSYSPSESLCPTSVDAYRPGKSFSTSGLSKSMADGTRTTGTRRTTRGRDDDDKYGARCPLTYRYHLSPCPAFDRRGQTQTLPDDDGTNRVYAVRMSCFEYRAG